MWALPAQVRILPLTPARSRKAEMALIGFGGFGLRERAYLHAPKKKTLSHFNARLAIKKPKPKEDE